MGAWLLGPLKYCKSAILWVHIVGATERFTDGFYLYLACEVPSRLVLLEVLGLLLIYLVKMLSSTAYLRVFSKV